jgi:hypothetical protein
MPAETRVAILECAGNSRVFLVPQVRGAQSELGAVGNAAWTGVPLCVLLERAGLEEDACEIVLEGPNPQEYLSKPLDFAAKMLLNRGTKLSDLWLPVRINGDIALFKGLMKEMLAEEDRRPGEILDWDFIRRYTVGYDELAASLRATSWEDILASSGLSRNEIRAAAEIALNARSIICCGHGTDPTPKRGGYHPGGDQLSAVAW